MKNLLLFLGMLMAASATSLEPANWNGATLEGLSDVAILLGREASQASNIMVQFLVSTKESKYPPHN